MAGPAPTLNPWSRRVPDPLQSQRSSTVTNPRPPHEVQLRSTDLEHRLARCVELLAHCPPECRPHVAARLDALESLLAQVATPADEAPQ